MSETKRTVVPAMEDRLFERTPVLDHGWIQLVDYSGDEHTIANRARLSYASTDLQRSEGNVKLIRQLYRERHSAPFEQCNMTVYMKLPLFVAAQFATHRTAKRGQQSARYTEMCKEMYVPDLDRIREQSKTSKQGSGDPLCGFVALSMQNAMRVSNDQSYELYQRLLDSGLTRELARIQLPQSLYTTMYFQIDARNLLHLLGLRQSPHAQWEIQQYAGAIADLFRVWMPDAWKAYEDYTRESVVLSRAEISSVRAALSGLDDIEIRNIVLAAEGLTDRERREFAAKLRGWK